MDELYNHRSNSNQRLSNSSLKSSAEHNEDIREQTVRTTPVLKDVSSDVSDAAQRDNSSREMVGSSLSTGEMNGSPKRTTDPAGRSASDGQHVETVVLLNDGLTEVVLNQRKVSSENKKEQGLNEDSDVITSGGLGRSGSCKSIDDNPPPYKHYAGRPTPHDYILKKVNSCYSGYMTLLEIVQQHVHTFLEKNHKYIMRVGLALILVGYAAYLVMAGWTSLTGAKAILGFSGFILGVVLLRLISRFYGKTIDARILAPIRKIWHSRWCMWMKW